MLRLEKNQQLMCDAGLMAAVLGSCRPALEDEGHLLHSPFQVIINVSILAFD